MINAFNLGMDILTRLQPELTNLRKNNTKQTMARERIIPKITMSIPSISEMIKQIGPLPPSINYYRILRRWIACLFRLA